MSSFAHVPVMLEECMDCLNVREGSLFADGTLGGGGHSEAILGRGASVIGIDRDPSALRAADERLLHFAPRYRSLHGNFADIGALLEGIGVHRVDGVLLDIGVSSHQIDTAERGFSYHEDAPLDMRMDPTRGMTAADIVNTYPERELTRILREYGEEKWAARIAQFIVKSRPLTTTMDLVAVIDAAIPKSVRIHQTHPARRTFQAIRIEVNGELAALEKALDGAMEVIRPGGRLVVITFHSLEDRIVKNAFRRMENPCICPPSFPMCVCGKKPYAKVITRKPLEPAPEEVERNPRSHSAKVRCAEHSSNEE